MTALALAASVLAGCGGEDEVEDDAAWRMSQDPVDVTGLSWATGSTVHLADGTTVDTGEPVQAFVVGGDGVFFVPRDDESDGTFRGAELLFAAPDGEATDTGLRVDTGGLRTSPNGRHLAVLEADYDEGSAVMRLFDLSTGEDLSAEDGMEAESSDAVDELLEAEVEILAIDDDAVYARTLQGDYAFDLATGKGRRLGDDEDVPGYGRDPLVSPDRTWRISETPTRTDELISTTNETVVPATGTERWDLDFWADSTTVVGNTVEGPGTGDEPDPRDSLALMSCVVPSGACEVFAESTGAEVVFPSGMTDFYGVTYPDGSEG